MILEFKLIQEYSDVEGKKQDIIKFAVEDSVNAKDMTIEFIKHGEKESSNIFFVDEKDLDELSWFISLMKQKNKK